MSPAPNFDAMLPQCEIVVPESVADYRASTGKRRGIMIHYDASQSDEGALSWFRSAQWKLSYHRAYTDSGRRVQILPRFAGTAAFHAGVCDKRQGVTSANDAFYGLSITATEGDRVTDKQLNALVEDSALIAEWHRRFNPDPELRVWWQPDNIHVWLTGHNEWAIFNERDNPKTPKLWGKLGRKLDPVGPDPDAPVLSLVAARARIRDLMDTPGAVIWERLQAQ